MSKASFDFKAISDDARDELLADPFFSTLPSLSGSPVVTSDDPKDIDTEIQEKLNNIGLGMIVLLPPAHCTRPNVRGPFFDRILVTVKIYENPIVNRDVSNNGGNNPTAAQCATAISGILHQFFPPSVNESFYVVECIPVLDPDFNVWQVTFKTGAGINYPRKPIAPVVATPAGPGPVQVGLTCATPGAAIWYTLDGTYPSPRNPSSNLYVPSSPYLSTDTGAPVPTDAGTVIAVNGGFSLAPLNIAAGTLLKARAWLSGYMPSNPAELVVQY